MDIAFKDPRLKNEHSESDPQQKDAPFSEIYELIFYNQSLVPSELKVLQLLIHNKLKHDAATVHNKNNENAHRAYKRQAVIGRILKIE